MIIYVVSATAYAQVSSFCDGDVRVLPNRNYWELHLVFKPNSYIVDTSFGLRFEPPVHCTTCYLDVRCPNDNTNTCVVDASRKLFYVTLKDYHQTGRPTTVSVYRYAQHCKWTARKTLHMPGTYFIVLS